MSPDRRYDIETYESHRSNGIVVRLRLSVALSIMQVTVRFDSVPPPIWRENTPRVVRDFLLIFLFHQPHKRTWWPL
ncbi:hypothetical protein TNCV_3378061 [Trichonephila clavipes]|nr:hypothetical protein TNCV_3378061 [Trichonephila clavipes]